MYDRTTGLGGTDIAAILGVNPYKTALNVYAEKVGISPDIPDNEAMWTGRVLEPHMLAWYAEEKGYLLRRPMICNNCGFEFVSWARTPEGLMDDHCARCAGLGKEGTVEVRPYTDSEVPFFKGLPDAECCDHTRALIGGVDAKAVSERMQQMWGTPGTDQVPEYYLIQAQWYMMLSKLPWWDIVATKVMRSRDIYHIVAHEGLHNFMRESALRFWHDYVEKKIPPPPEGDNPEKEREALAKIYPGAANTRIEATAYELGLMMEYRELDKAGKEIDKQIKAIQAKLQAKMGNAVAIDSQIGSVTWPSVQGNVSYTKVVAALQELYGIDDAVVDEVKDRNRNADYRRMRPYWKKD